MKLSKSSLLVSWSIVLAVSTAIAAQSAPRSLTFEELAGAAIAKGESIRVSGPYLELLDEHVQLFGSPVAFVVHDPAVRRSILSISAEHRNLTFEATRKTSIQEDPVFEVTRATAAPDSASLFATEIERLKSHQTDGTELLFKLGSRILRISNHYKDSSLKPLANRACVAAIEVQTRLLPPDDVETRLKLTVRAFDVCGDKTLAVELLARLEDDFPTHDGIRKQLSELGARRFRGEWMTYDEFKRRQGFERHGTVWVSAREKEFLGTIFALRTGKRELIIRKRTTAEYRVLASRGELATGMVPQEVVESIGFADRVYHREVGGQSYDQWEYADRFCYFENGKLRRWTARDGSQAATP